MVAGPKKEKKKNILASWKKKGPKRNKKSIIKWEERKVIAPTFLEVLPFL